MTEQQKVQALWTYLTDIWTLDEIRDGFNECVEEPKVNIDTLTNAAIAKMSDEEASAFLFDMSYMALYTFFGSDWGTWSDVMESLGFDEDTLDNLAF